MSMTPVLRAPTPDDLSSVHYPTSISPSPYAPPGATPTPAPTQPSGIDTQMREDSFAYVKSILADYGLESLAGWAWDQLVTGHSSTVILQELHQKDEFKNRFPVIARRKAANLPPMSVAEILSYEKQAKQLFRSSGLPLGFYDSYAELQDMMGQDVSLSELSSRIQLATSDYYNTDPVVRDELARLYNLSPGQHLSFILDPDKALPLIERQWLSAQISAESQRSTYGGLTRDEAEQLASQGVTAAQAGKGFSTLAAERGLFDPLPGEAADQITRGEQVAAAFYNDASAQERIRQRQQSRLAPYQGGGGYAAGTGGISGLGSRET